MRTIRVLLIPAALFLFSGALLALPGCGGGGEEAPGMTSEEAKIQSQAREEYAKAEKQKAKASRSQRRGSSYSP